VNIENPLSKKDKRVYWANHVKQWKASGGSQSDYCRCNQLKPHQFTYWKHVFSTMPKQDFNPKPAIANGFVAVQLTHSSNPQAQEQALMIQLPNGIRIENPRLNSLALIREMSRWQT